jgi:hypothetical protein
VRMAIGHSGMKCRRQRREARGGEGIPQPPSRLSGSNSRLRRTILLQNSVFLPVMT